MKKILQNAILHLQQPRDGESSADSVQLLTQRDFTCAATHTLRHTPTHTPFASAPSATCIEICVLAAVCLMKRFTSREKWPRLTYNRY